MTGPKVPQPSETRKPRILILRLSALGDVVLALPVASAVRVAHPGAWITWAAEPGPARLIANHPDVDEVVTVPKRWMFRPGLVLALYRQLRAQRFDWAIDVQGLAKSALLGKLAGARRQVTFATRDAREFSPLLATDVVYPRATHIVERNLELLQVLGIRVSRPEFRLGAFPEAARRVLLWCGELLNAEAFAIINPGASWPSKRWPPDRFAAVARHLADRWGLSSFVVWGNREERRLAEMVVAQAPAAAYLAPPTTLEELVELARRSRIFISADTGPLHLAAAVGTPCVGLYGPWPAERCGPYGPQHVWVQKMRLDGPSRLRRRAPTSFMEAIDIPTVCAACDEILSRYRTAAPAAA